MRKLFYHSLYPKFVVSFFRLVGSVFLIELIMERVRRFESNKAQVVSVLELPAMNPQVPTV